MATASREISFSGFVVQVLVLVLVLVLLLVLVLVLVQVLVLVLVLVQVLVLVLVLVLMARCLKGWTLLGDQGMERCWCTSLRETL